MKTRMPQTVVPLFILATVGVLTDAGCSSNAPIGETSEMPDAALSSDGGAPSSGLDAASDVAVAADAAADADADVSDSGVVDAEGDDAASDSGVDAGPTCGADQKLCGMACVSLDDPATGCGGATCTPCATAPNQAAACNPQGCTAGKCLEGYEDCKKDVDGCETATGSDPNNCGGCNVTCHTVCSKGSCLPVAPTAHLPDAYRLLCTNGTVAGPAVCPAPGGPLYGQDGNFTANKPAYRVVAGTVYDPVSGLMWESTFPAGSQTRVDAKAHCDAINAISFAGYKDWRLPTIFEALTLADAGNNYLPMEIFTGQTENSGIWTSTPFAFDATKNWLLGSNWNTPIATANTTPLPSSALCVRGALAAGGFTMSASGNLVTDTRTGLVWQRAMAPSTYSWSQALAYCNGLTVDGIGGFRLPSYKELWSTVDVTKFSPAFDTTLFPGTPIGRMWTSTAVYNQGTNAYALETDTGAANNFTPAQTTTLAVRCVSGG